MSELTIPARLVAEGVGLPAVWRDRNGVYQVIQATHLWGHEIIDLSDPQTAFGLALKLDEWDRAGCTGRKSWALVVYESLGWSDEHRANAMQAMAARITQIGMDHAIRRALGWGEPEKGTLMELRRSTVSPFDYDDGPGWKLKVGNDSHFFWEEGSDTLAGITDPAEALRAIYEEVCND